MDNNESRGLGDSIKKITAYFGIEQCDGCKDRQEFLNQLVPYTKKPLFTPEQITLVESLLLEPIKYNCKQLNDIRKTIDGVWLDNCFCDHLTRHIFIREYKQWFDLHKNN